MLNIPLFTTGFIHPNPNGGCLMEFWTINVVSITHSDFSRDYNKQFVSIPMNQPAFLHGIHDWWPPRSARSSEKNPKENREEAEAKFKDIAEALEKWMGVSLNGGTPKIIHFNKAFHYKPSILGYHFFWKHPDGWQVTIRLPFGDFGIFSGANS